MANRNPYKASAQARKAAAVYLITEKLKKDTGRSDAAMLTWLKGLDNSGWAALAVIAGTTPLSDESRELVWRQYVQTARVA